MQEARAPARDAPAALRTFFATARALLETPLRDIERIDTVKTVVGVIPHVRDAVHTPASPHHAEALRLATALRDELLYNTLLPHYHLFVGAAQLEFEHPISAGTVIFIAAALLHVVVETARGPLPDGPSVSGILNEMEVLNMRWHEVGRTPAAVRALADRLHVLLARALVLAVSPAPARFHDVPALRVEDREHPGIFHAVPDLERRFAGGLARMLVVARFVAAHADVREEQAPPEALARVRGALAVAAATMESMPTLRAEMGNMFNEAAISHGDLDAYAEVRNAVEGRPRDIVYMTKPPEVQQAWSYLAEALSVRALCLLDEDAPRFDDLYTFGHLRHAQNVKLYIAETFTRPCGLRVLANASTSEQHFVTERARIVAEGRPTLVDMFGHFHVVHGAVLHWCRSTEHALLVWAEIVRAAPPAVGSGIDGEKRDECLRRLLGESAVFAADDDWRDGPLLEGFFALGAAAPQAPRGPADPEREAAPPAPPAETGTQPPAATE